MIGAIRHWCSPPGRDTWGKVPPLAPRARRVTGAQRSYAARTGRSGPLPHVAPLRGGHVGIARAQRRPLGRMPCPCASQHHHVQVYLDPSLPLCSSQSCPAPGLVRPWGAARRSGPGPLPPGVYGSCQALMHSTPRGIRSRRETRGIGSASYQGHVHPRKSAFVDHGNRSFPSQRGRLTLLFSRLPAI